MNEHQQTGGDEGGAVVPIRRPLKGEGCGDPYGITTGEQALGILKLHENCEPPCLRREAAFAVLGMEIPQQGTGQADGRGPG